MRFLYAAYVVTWVIHILYLLSLTARFRRLKREMSELQRAPR
jgi:CcmD family protein